MGSQVEFLAVAPGTRSRDWFAASGSNSTEALAETEPIEGKWGAVTMCPLPSVAIDARDPGVGKLPTTGILNRSVAGGSYVDSLSK